MNPTTRTAKVSTAGGIGFAETSGLKRLRFVIVRADPISQS